VLSHLHLRRLCPKMRACLDWNHSMQLWNNTTGFRFYVCGAGIVVSRRLKTAQQRTFILSMCRFQCSRSIPIAERFFISNISVQLIQASWYPVATSSVPHLCLLTSDNMLRIYNVRSDPQVPVQSHKLMPSDSSNLSLTGSRMSLLSM